MKLEYWHKLKTLGISLVSIETGESEAYTIVDVDETTNRVSIQLDDATLKSSFKQNIMLDGHFICCVNQDEQLYDYVSNTKNPLIYLFAKDGKSYKVEGKEDKFLVVPGRRKFVDITKELLKEHVNLNNQI